MKVCFLQPTSSHPPVKEKSILGEHNYPQFKCSKLFRTIDPEGPSRLERGDGALEFDARLTLIFIPEHVQFILMILKPIS